MRGAVLIIFMLVGFHFVQGQKETKPTTSFTISGEVKNATVVHAADLSKWTIQNINDIVITNHLGEKKSEAKGMKGVLLKDVLQSVELIAESPKVLSEFYFVCKANDGYTVVYSWNEIFNTTTGNSAFILTEKDGKSTSGMNDAIMMVSTGDLKTGRRHLKALMTIEVKRATKP